MQREIKFRGKRRDNGEWVYGNLHRNFRKGTFVQITDFDTNESFMVDPETVGQFTGLFDKAKNEVYEHDIVQSTYIKIKYNCVIIWQNGAYKMRYPEKPKWKLSVGSQTVGFGTLAKNVIVIGNRFDNPDLLKEIE